MRVEDDFTFQCPYCWQPTAIQVELIHGNQQFVEDCQVCCNPIEISFRVRNGEVVDFQASSSDTKVQ